MSKDAAGPLAIGVPALDLARKRFPLLPSLARYFFANRQWRE
jgi:hypothetical protein